MRRAYGLELLRYAEGGFEGGGRRLTAFSELRATPNGNALLCDVREWGGGEVLE